MKKQRYIRLLLKNLFPLIMGIFALTLLVACDGLPIGTPPTDEELAEPPTDEELAEPPTEETADKLPGTQDFDVDEETSNGGALLGSPAFDMFLEIEGVPGESTDDEHGEWIDILSYSWGVSQPGAGTMSSGGLRSAERSEHYDFSIVKTIDKASPKLALYSCNGTHIEKVILELCRATGDKQEFMVYEMTDVLVSSVSVSGSAGEALPLEEVTFTYGRIEWTYTEFDLVTDAPKGDVQAHWNLETNSGG